MKMKELKIEELMKKLDKEKQHVAELENELKISANLINSQQKSTFTFEA